MNILKLIYPERCPFCNEIIRSSEILCCDCEKNHPFNFLNNQFYVQESQFTSISPFAYKDNIKKAIWKFKFRDHQEYATFFGNSICSAIKHFNKISFDIITSVPISKKRLKTRGYNQTELFAKKVSQKLKIKYRRLLIKHKNNLEQHMLSLEKRCLNVKDVYRAKNLNLIKNKKILLCDDIITTGNTIGECRKILLNSGAADVFCATIATV